MEKSTAKTTVKVQTPEIKGKNVEEKMMHTLEESKTTKPQSKEDMMKSKKHIIIAAVIIVAGVVTGFGLSRVSGGKGGSTTLISGENGKSVQKVVGVKDVSKKDTTEGILKEGGIEKEGTHHLERPGGPSQNVYLTSSVVPLDDYLEKKVKVWGDTFDAQKAGWLMDVVRLEVLE